MVVESSKPGGVNFIATQQQYYFFSTFSIYSGCRIEKKGLLKGFKHAKNSKKGRNGHFNN